MTDQDPTQRYDVPPAGQAPGGPPPPPATGAAASPPTVEPAPAVPTAPVGPAAPPTANVLAQDATAAPVAPPAQSQRGWLKWAVALVVVVLAAGTALAATQLLTSDSGGADVLSWTPADSPMYAELRLDLPGDQQAEVAELMSAFPGFDDQAAFPTKLDEALDQLMGKASDGKVSYQQDIAPWFGGQLAMSLGPVPDTADAKDVRALMLAGTTDAAKATSWAAELLQETGASTSTETYDGVTITTITPPPGTEVAGADMHIGYAAFGPVLALGDPASLKASIDTGGTSGLDTDEQFQAATEGVTGDRLGLAYVDGSALIDLSTTLSEQADASAMPALPSFYDDLTAPWTVMVLRAEDGAFVVDTRAPHVAALGPAKTATSTLPSVVPPDTMLLVEGHDVGEAVLRFRDLAASDPDLADGLKQVDDALAIVGGLDALVGWMGEAGVAITPAGDPIGGGVVIVPSDEAAAERLLTQLRGFLQLAGGGSGITVTDEAYGDATITTVTIDGAALGGATAFATPVGSVSVAYAVTDEVVVLGYGTDFVKGVLDAVDGESLADTTRFKDALAKADDPNGSLFWIDVAATRSLIEPLMPEEERTRYDADVKPYLEPFDSVISTSVPGEEIDSGTMVITVAGS